MRKVLVVMCLMALGGGIAVGATTPQKLAWVSPIDEGNLSFTISPDTGWFIYNWPPTVIGGTGAKDTFLLALHFDPSVFEFPDGSRIGYPFWIRGLGAFFYEFLPDHPWVDGKFKFLIYGDDGATKLHESKELTARKQEDNTAYPTEYMLEKDSVEISEGTFWVAVDEIDPGGTPMILLDNIFLGYSYAGRPGNWHSIEGAELIMMVNLNYTPVPAVEEKLFAKSVPLTLELSESPVHNRAEIRYSLSNTGPVTLEIFDISGRPVYKWNSSKIENGSHTLFWDGINNQGIKVPNGAYFCRLSSKDASVVKKIVLVR